MFSKQLYENLGMWSSVLDFHIALWRSEPLYVMLPLYVNLCFPPGMSPVAVPNAPLLSHLWLCLNLLFPNPPSIVLFLFWFPGTSHNPSPQWMGMFHHPNELYPSYLPILNFFLASALFLLPVSCAINLQRLLSALPFHPFISFSSYPCFSPFNLCLTPPRYLFSLLLCLTSVFQSLHVSGKKGSYWTRTSRDRQDLCLQMWCLVTQTWEPTSFSVSASL